MTTVWTDIPKVGTSGSTDLYTGGDPIGLLLALTYTTITPIQGGTSWTDVPKASGTSWIDVPKAT